MVKNPSKKLAIYYFMESIIIQLAIALTYYFLFDSLTNTFFPLGASSTSYYLSNTYIVYTKLSPRSTPVMSSFSNCIRFFDTYGSISSRSLTHSFFPNKCFKKFFVSLRPQNLSYKIDFAAITPINLKYRR